MAKIVGILNITPDSFSDGGKFDSLEGAISHLKKLIADGADVIDVGAESTRPQAVPISAQQEWQRLEKILPAIIFASKKTSKSIKVSLDSYHFENLKKAHELGVDIINDVSGLSDERIVDFIAAKNIETILMHNSQVLPIEGALVNSHLNLCFEILSWAKQKISALQKKGVKKSQLIFDPGIGFGKNAAQSIRILKNIAEFGVLDLPIYVGHSKKSFLDAIKIEGDRAQKTLIISKFLLQKKVDFLRVHDVLRHKEILI